MDIGFWCRLFVCCQAQDDLIMRRARTAAKEAVAWQRSQATRTPERKGGSGPAKVRAKVQLVVIVSACFLSL